VPRTADRDVPRWYFSETRGDFFRSECGALDRAAAGEQLFAVRYAGQVPRGVNLLLRDHPTAIGEVSRLGCAAPFAEAEVVASARPAKPGASASLEVGFTLDAALRSWPWVVVLEPLRACPLLLHPVVVHPARRRARPAHLPWMAGFAAPRPTGEQVPTSAP